MGCFLTGCAGILQLCKPTVAAAVLWLVSDHGGERAAGEALDWFVYTYSAVVRPVGCDCQILRETETVYFQETNI